MQAMQMAEEFDADTDAFDSMFSQLGAQELVATSARVCRARTAFVSWDVRRSLRA